MKMKNGHKTKKFPIHNKFSTNNKKKDVHKNGK